jgi:hypothetical protein
VPLLVRMFTRTRKNTQGKINIKKLLNKFGSLKNCYIFAELNLKSILVMETKKVNNTRLRKLRLFYQAIKRKICAKFDNFTRHEPMVKAEAVEKTLYLLRRDFDMAEQNDIVITLIQKLHEKREADIIKLQEQMDMMKEQSQKLKEKVVLT